MTEQEPIVAPEVGTLAAKFNTISDIIKDPFFIERVRVNLFGLIKQRNGRTEPEPGFYYKRDWYDRMDSSESLTTEHFVSNIESLWQKKSRLSSEERGVISYVCDISLTETLMEYSKKESGVESV